MSFELQTSFYFGVYVSGLAGVDAAFQEVSGLSKELGTEDVVCGGENRFKYRLPTTTTFKNLVLKRGVTPTDSLLLSWVKDTLDDGLANPISPKDIQVMLFDANGVPSIMWTFTSAYPVKWSAKDLNSQGNEIFIETLEFAYQYFEIDDQIVETAGLFDE